MHLAAVKSRASMKAWDAMWSENLSDSALECLCKLLDVQAVTLQATDVIFTGMLKLPSGQRIENAGCALAGGFSSWLRSPGSACGGRAAWYAWTPTCAILRATG